MRSNRVSIPAILGALIMPVVVGCCGVISATPQTRLAQTTVSAVSEAERREWEKITNRFKEHHNWIAGLGWTLIHSYESKSEMDRALEVFQSIGFAVAGTDPASVRKFNGPRGIKKRLLNLMDSKDGTVSGFAASMLAIIGDESYAPDIARLMDRGETRKDKFPATVRGQAAMALGVLGSRQYAPRIARMLRSNNDYDRSGAASALAELKAREYSRDIAKLLTPDVSDSDDDNSAIFALFEMGVAGSYKAEIASVLRAVVLTDRAVTAAYALSRLRAKEYAPDIAKLLEDEFKAGDGAKALALLGAREYSDRIALLLTDKRSFNRKDAVLALGILGAREQAPAISKLLKEEELWVRLDAAKALVLMEATEYAAAVLPVIAEQKAGPYIDFDELHEIVSEDAKLLDTRFESLLGKMKAAQVARP